MEISTGLIAVGVVGLVALASKKAAALPAIVTVEPKPDAKPPSIEGTIRAAAAFYSEDPELMLALAKTESSMNPLAVNPSDPSYGLFQIQIFWLKFFGYPAPATDAAALDQKQNPLFTPSVSADVAARILGYFRGRVNPLTHDHFRFPEEIDVYNVGETLWAKGRRNLAYRDKVTKFYRDFGGTQ